MYKVFLKGNYLIVVNTATNEEMEGLASNVMIHRKLDNSTSWMFHGLNGLTDGVEIPESQIKDESGSDYADFDTWRSENTGTPVAAGGGVTGALTDAELRAAPINTISSGVDYFFSTANSTSTQLAAGASFVGTIESIILYPSISFLAFADQNLTITIYQFIDAAGTKISESRTISYVAGEKLGISFPINGNYARVTVKNEGGSTTNTLQVDTAYGEIESTNLSQDDYLRGQAAQTAVVNNILTPVAGSTPIDVTKFRSFTCQVVSTGTGGTFIFEGSNDGTNFQAIPVYNQALTVRVQIVSAITATASQIIYEGSCNFKFIRLRIATTITGGSIQAHALLSHESYANTINNVSNGTAANLLATVSGTVTANIGTGSLAAGTNVIGDFGIQLRANATGAATPTAINCPATPVGQSIKGTAGRIVGLYVNNSNGAVRYLKVFNTASVTMGTTSAVYEIAIPANNNPQWISLPAGLAASTAIVIAVTGGAGLTNNTAVTLGDVTGFIAFA